MLLRASRLKAISRAKRILGLVLLPPLPQCRSIGLITQLGGNLGLTFQRHVAGVPLQAAQPSSAQVAEPIQTAFRRRATRDTERLFQ